MLPKALLLFLLVFLYHIPSSYSATTISVTSTVQRSNVYRLGLNLGGRSTGDHMMKNMLDNPGFEAGEKAINMLAASDCTTTKFIQGGGWFNLQSTQPDGFWNGARFLFLTGVNQGRQGSITTYLTDSSGRGVYNLNFTLPQVPAQNDVMAVYKSFPTALPFVADPRTGSPGKQSIKIDSASPVKALYDGGYRDADYTIGKTLLIKGNWTVKFWAKSPAAGQKVNFFFGREQWAGGATFYSSAFTVNTANLWTSFSVDFSVASTLDQPFFPTTPCANWPSCGRPFVEISFSVSSGTVFLDDVNLYQRDDTNPTVFTDRVVNLLKEYNPGVLRNWGSQLGASFASEVATELARGTHGYRPDGGYSTFDYSLHEFLQLCAHIGTDPWYVVPPTFFPSESLALIEYLAGPATSTWGSVRAQQGQSAPWTSVFGNIYLEYGNELWGSGAPNDPFGGASMGGVNEGKALKYTFGIMKSSPYYNTKIKTIAGGQAGWSGQNSLIETNGGNHNLMALAPYYGNLQVYDTAQNKYGPLWAFPVQEKTSGNFNQTAVILQQAGKGTGLAIYEINFHFTNPGAPAHSIRNPWMTGVGGGINLPWSSLNYLQYFNAQPICAFTFVGYSFLYEGSLYPFQCVQGSTCSFAKVWGLLRDLSGLGTKRPSWLAMEATNSAIYTNLITTTQVGDNPVWTQSAINSITAPMQMRYINSFAFSSGTGKWSLVVFNFHLTSTLTINIQTPTTPAAAATRIQLQASTLETGNEQAQTVSNVVTQINNFSNGYAASLPPFSLTIFKWSSA